MIEVKPRVRAADDLDAAGRPERLADVTARVGIGVVMNCAFGDRLRARRAAGDVAAERALADCAPVDIPARAKLAWRDAQIRMAARDLSEVLPNGSRHAIALVLAHAGDQVSRGRRLTVQPEFSALMADERERLEAAVRYVLDTEVSWPGVRTIENILGVCSVTP